MYLFIYLLLHSFINPFIYSFIADNEIESGREFEILSNGHVLVVRQARRALQGVYTCRADSQAGSITASARLVVADNGTVLRACVCGYVWVCVCVHLCAWMCLCVWVCVSFAFVCVGVYTVIMFTVYFDL
jgi:hypothetical protein